MASGLLDRPRSRARWSPAALRRGTPRGLTLVELLVAVTLSVILIGVMTFVWVQSNKIFSTQLNRIETYQRVRVIMDTMERDLANTQLTSDMEFFLDQNQDGFYDQAVDQVMPASKGGGDFRAPNDETDPLLGQPEFALGASDVLNGPDFVRAPTIISPDPYEITTDGYLDARSYWRDEVYVRSFITIGDKNRPALIHYRLVQTNPGGGTVPNGRSMLRRRIWYLDAGTTPPTVSDMTDQYSILAADICDLKVGFLFKQSPLEGNMTKFHVAADQGGFSQTQHNDLLEQDHRQGFVSTHAGRTAAGFVAEPLSAQHTGNLTDETRVSFVFEGNARIEERTLGPVTLRGLRGDQSTDLESLDFDASLNGKDDYDNFDFRGVRPGTRIMLYDATDDDSNTVTTGRAAESRFPTQLFTIETIPAEVRSDATNTDETFVSMQFLEPINFARLRASWLGQEDRIRVDTGDCTPQFGPDRQIIGSFNVRYRVGFLPAAFVIRLSVDDRNNQKVIPMERIIRLLQQ